MIYWLTLSILKSVFYTYFALYAIVHLLLFYSPQQFAQLMIFQNYVTFHFGEPIKSPIEYGFDKVHNFYLDVEPDVKIGVWHFLPDQHEYAAQQDSLRSIEDHFVKYFGTNKNKKEKIIIYIHGNDGDRAFPKRMVLCKKLTEFGHHVFAVDYRGYGDSTGIPSEKGIIKDVLTLYKLISFHHKDAEIYIWGHSLGSGIACHVSKNLTESNTPPAGVVLEAPFRNILQASKEYFLSLPFLNNPWILKKVADTLESLELRFENDKNIAKINSKILIFHAEDDWLIPHDQSNHLLEVCKTQRPKHYPPCERVQIAGVHGLGHGGIMSHEPVYPVVKAFFETIIKQES